MFSFFRKKADSAHEVLPGAAALSDSQLIEAILSVFKNQSPVVGALFLVAWENIPVYYPSFHKAMEEEELFPASLEGMSSFFAAEHNKHGSDSEADEVARRRFFYFYTAALLKVAHLRAKAKTELWEDIADIWVALLPGARALRSTLDRTNLWRKEHIDFFDSVKSEDEGEWHCLHIEMPGNLRYHKKIIAWLERDLTPEQRKLIDETCNISPSQPTEKPSESSFREHYRAPIELILPSFMPVLLERGIPGYESVAISVTGEIRLTKTQIRSLLAAAAYLGALEHVGSQNFDVNRIKPILTQSLLEVPDLTAAERKFSLHLVDCFFGCRVIRENHSFDDWVCEVWWSEFQAIPYSYPSAMADAVAYGLGIRETLCNYTLEY